MKKWILISSLFLGSLGAEFVSCPDHSGECMDQCLDQCLDTESCLDIDPCCDKTIYALPANGPLMPPFLADPRKVGMSAGWRMWDRVINHVGHNNGMNVDHPANHSGPVSFGDYAGLVRFCNPFGCGGVLDIGIEGDVWAIFQQTRESAPLVNADYYVAIPVYYSLRPWVFRARLFHISSHLGDEFLVNNPDYDRRNPSSEYFDFFATYNPSCDLRLYAGVGVIFRNDETFSYKPLYFEYGFGYYFPQCRFYLPKSQLMARPYMGAHFRNRQDTDYHFDGTFVLGYEWARLYADKKKVRIYLEYHNGYSQEGQFSRLPTEYGALVAFYGY